MVTRAGERGETDIAVEHDGFGLARHAGQPETRRQLAGVHHAAGEARILAIMHDQRVEILRVGHGATQDLRIAQRAFAVAKGDGASLSQQADFGDFAPLQPFGQRGAGHNAHAAGITGAAHQEIHDRRIVDRRARFRRRDDRRHAARRGGRARRGDGFAMFGARLADKRAHVDQTGANDIAAALHDAHIGRQILCADLNAEADDHAAFDIDPAARFRLCLRIDQPGVEQRNRLGSGRRLHGISQLLARRRPAQRADAPASDPMTAMTP